MKADRQDALSLGLTLIGIGILFLLPGVGFWPWILVVVALGSVPTALKRGGNWWAWQSIFWLIGLAILFALGVFWPGVLLLAGVSVLLGGLAPHGQGSRTLPNEGAAEGTPEPVDPADAAWRELSTSSLDVDEPLFEEGSGASERDDDVPPSEVAGTAGSNTRRL